MMRFSHLFVDATSQGANDAIKLYKTSHYLLTFAEGYSGIHLKFDEIPYIKREPKIAVFQRRSWPSTSKESPKVILPIRETGHTI